MVKCPICNSEMTFENGIWICNDNSLRGDKGFGYHKIVVLCKCERRMIPKAKYKNGILTFWECPHCFNRK